MAQPEQTPEVSEAPRATVSFERKVNLADYESATASVYIQVPTEIGDDLEAIVAKAKPTFLGAKSTVYEQLGIQFEITGDLVAIESLEKVLGATEVSPEKAAEEIAEVAKASAASKKTSDNKGTPAPETKDGLWEELEAHPKRWFDNRETKVGKRPDFKRKYTAEGLWADDKKRPEGVTIPEPSAF